MENFPSALVIASYDSVCHNNNVLYRLVRPLPDGSGVQSTDRLVNVVPFRRKYTFEKKQQLIEFGQEMLRRPLVLQPVLHFGRGFGNYCPTCYKDELWLVMVNQTHPKILSRLQMGLDSAKVAIEKGQPFEIKFRFGKLIQRVYQEHLAQRERQEAQTSNSAFLKYLTYFRYAEWEYGDLQLRYHGYGAALNRTSAYQSLPSLEKKWNFEDIGMHDMVWSQFNGQVYPRPHLSPVSEDEIRQLLPGWTVNGVSPLQNIGDSIPEYNYDYAQAGRLYASFRKKKRRHRPLQQKASDHLPYSTDSGDDSYEDDEYDEEALDTIGLDPSASSAYVNPEVNSVEHNFRHFGIDNSKQPSRSRQIYQNSRSPHQDEAFYQNINNQNLNQRAPQSSHNDTVDSGSNKKPIKTYNAEAQSSNGIHQVKSSSAALSQPDKYGHIYSNVEIRPPIGKSYQHQSQTSIHRNQRVELDAKSHHLQHTTTSNQHSYAGVLKKQDSDRSSKSTIADSGYCPEGDSDRSRGGSYDYNEQGYSPRHKQDFLVYENNPAHNSDGLVNPAFSMNGRTTDRALQKHKQQVSKAIKDEVEGNTSKASVYSVSDHNLGYIDQIKNSSYGLSPKDIVGDVMKAPPRQKRAATSSSTPKVAESYI